ncbi:MAG: PulJ/GspJ family protein [Phycisphaerales bacterium]
MKRSRSSQPVRGFTLIEVLIAIALLVALLGTMFTLYQQMLATRSRIQDQTARGLAASIMIDRIERALATTLVGDNIAGAGINGNATSLRILSRATAIHLASRGDLQALAVGDLQALDFTFSPGDGTLTGRMQALATPTSAANDNSRAWTIGTAGDVRFRYLHDRGEWVDTFDSLVHGHLPRAIEVAIWIRDQQTETEDDFVESEDDDDLAFEELDFLTADDRASQRPQQALPPDRLRVIYIVDADSPQPDDVANLADRRAGAE